MDDRALDLTEQQKKTKAKYPAINKKYECDDMISLLYHFLDDWLYKFSADLFFVPREVKVLHIDRMRFRIRSIGWGEEFNLTKHPQGTEVKAITYSAMQIHEENKPQVFVIIDI
ncbi:ARCH archease, partial [Polyodon spathula]|nr:ARCH archease [Polyodon spathula]